MSLRKEICKRCMAFTRTVNGIRDDDGNMKTNKPCPWRPRDERLWSLGIVHCPGSMVERTHVEAFKDCSYAVEHVVSQVELGVDRLDQKNGAGERPPSESALP